MNKSIFYPQDNGRVAQVLPALNCGFTIEEIARKDVPAGKPYVILDDSLVPSSTEFFEAWEVDFSSPHGFGIGHEAWFAEQASKEQA